MTLDVELEVNVIEKITIEVSDTELEEWAKDAGLKVSELSKEELKRFLDCGDPDDEVYQYSQHYRPTSDFTITSVDFVKRPEPKG